MLETFKMLDRDLLLKINAGHTPFLDLFMWQMSQSWHTFLFIFIIAFVFYRKFDLKKAIALLLGCALIFACTDFSSNVVKHNVQRYRPTHNLEIKDSVHKVNVYEGGKFGFFSAHAANAFGITVFLFFCMYWINKKYRLLLFLYPLILSYSRIYLGVHYPSDIIAGCLDGLFFGTLGYFIINAQFLKLNEQDL